MQVHTSLGPGEVVERDSVRGRTQLLVAGRGFRKWFYETEIRTAAESILPSEHDEHINEDNSTTLPYNPEPQFSAELFNAESTIQPGQHEIDRDQRLSPADSLSFAERSEPSGPQPNPELFAREAARYANPAALVPALTRALPAVAPELADELEENPEAQNLRQKGLDESPLGAIFGMTYERPSSKYAFIHQRFDDSDPVQRFRSDPLAEIHRHGNIHSASHDPEVESYGHLIEADKELREAAWSDVHSKAKRLRAEGSVNVKEIGPNRIYAAVNGDNGTYEVLVLKGPDYAGIGKGASSATFSCNCQWGKWAFKRQYKFVGRMCSHALAAYHELQSQYLKDNPGHFKKKRRKASVVSDFQAWAEEVGAGIDSDAVTSYICERTDLSAEEVGKLYNHVSESPERKDTRDFKDPLDGWPDDDVLYSGPGRLEPSFIHPADDDQGSRSEFVDVTEDERDTTAPDKIVHFSHQRQAAPGDAGDTILGPSYRPEPSPSTGLSTNPFAGGGFDPTSLPGVAGSPNNAPPTDPTGGMMNDILGLPADGAAAPSGAATPSASGGGETADYKSWYPGSGGDSSGSAPTGGGAGGVQGPGIAGNPGTPADGGDIDTSSAYTIQSGDTLSDIAQRSGYGDDYQGLADAAGIADPDMIYAGDTIDFGSFDSAGAGASADTATHGVGAPADVATPDASSGIGTGTPPGPSTTTEPLDISTSASPPSLQEPGAGLADLTSAPEKTSRRFYADEDFEEEDPATAEAAEPAQGSEPSHDHAPELETNPDPLAGGAGLDPSMLMDFATPIASGLSGMAAPVMQGIGSGIGDAISGIFAGRYASVRTADLLEHLRNLTAESPPLQRMDEHNDEVAEVVEELRERGMDASQMVAAIEVVGEPVGFQGSGKSPKNWWGTSEAYVEDNERPRHVDVTDLDGDMIKYSDDKPQQKAGGYVPPEESFGFTGATRQAERTDDSSDIVRAFHASMAGGGAMSAEDIGGGSYSDDAIAQRAASMLRTAGRVYSLAEQRELEDESHPLGARNMPTAEDLAGTHYVN